MLIVETGTASRSITIFLKFPRMLAINNAIRTALANTSIGESVISMGGILVFSWVEHVKLFSHLDVHMEVFILHQRTQKPQRMQTPQIWHPKQRPTPCRLLSLSRNSKLRLLKNSLSKMPTWSFFYEILILFKEM